MRGKICLQCFEEKYPKVWFITKDSIGYGVVPAGGTECSLEEAKAHWKNILEIKKT